MAIGADLGWNKPSAYLLNNNYSDNRSRWGEDYHQMLQLMLGQVSIQQRGRTLDLLGGFSCTVELDQEVALPSGWEKRLDLKTGSVSFVDCRTGTSMPCETPVFSAVDLDTSFRSFCPRMGGSDSCLTLSFPLLDKLKSVNMNSKRKMPDDSSSDLCSLDLGLCLPNPSKKIKTVSSCLSPPFAFSETPSVLSFQIADNSCDISDKRIINKSAELESKSDPDMMALGCGKCLMYVMLSTADPKCPRCGTSAILDFPQSGKREAHLEIRL